MSPSSRARRASFARCAFATVAMVLVMMFSRLDAGAVTVAPPAVAFVEPESGPASATYREGQPYGLRLDVDGERVLEGTPASALVRATVTIVNAVDRAEETLTVTTQGGATSTFDDDVDDDNREGDSVGEASASTSAIRETLKLLNYTHSGNRIGELTRIVTLTVTDEAGRTSAPAAKMIDITRDNVKPTLDLNGPREGTTYEVSMSEAERMIGVRLSDIDYTCEDGDDVVINSVDGAKHRRLAAFQTGAVEYVSADTSGTSISSSWSAADKRLTLSNFDSVANYCRVVGTVRYHNEELNKTPPELRTPEANFERRLNFNLRRDGARSSSPSWTPREAVNRRTYTSTWRIPRDREARSTMI